MFSLAFYFIRTQRTPIIELFFERFRKVKEI